MLSKIAAKFKYKEAGPESKEADSKSKEEGSAVTEFVLIATPLFLPALLFFLSMQGAAMEEMRVENLARQTLRAFVTAKDTQQGHQRIHYVLEKFSELDSQRNKEFSFTYKIDCGGQECLTPGSKVKIELFKTFSTELDNGQSRKAVAVATSMVDRWRE